MDVFKEIIQRSALGPYSNWSKGVVISLFNLNCIHLGKHVGHIVINRAPEYSIWLLRKITLSINQRVAKFLLVKGFF